MPACQIIGHIDCWHRVKYSDSMQFYIILSMRRYWPGEFKEYISSSHVFGMKFH